MVVILMRQHLMGHEWCIMRRWFLSLPRIFFFFLKLISHIYPHFVASVGGKNKSFISAESRGIFYVHANSAIFPPPPPPTFAIRCHHNRTCQRSYGPSSENPDLSPEPRFIHTQAQAPPPPPHTHTQSTWRVWAKRTWNKRLLLQLA